MTFPLVTFCRLGERRTSPLIVSEPQTRIVPAVAGRRRDPARAQLRAAHRRPRLDRLSPSYMHLSPTTRGAAIALLDRAWDEAAKGGRREDGNRT